MTHSLTRTAIAGFALIAAIFAAQSADARTERQCKASAADTLVKDVLLVDHRVVMALEVHKNVVTTIELNGKIDEIIIPSHMLGRFWAQQTGKNHQVFEFKPTTARAKTITSFTLKSKHETVHLLIHVAKKAEDTGCLLYRVVSRPPEEVWKERLQPWVDEQLDEQRKHDVATFEAERQKERAAHESERGQERAAFERKQREYEAKAALDQRAAVAHFLLDRRRNTRPVPIEVKSAAGNPDLGVRVYEPAWNGTEFLIPFELSQNTSHKPPVTLAGIQAAAELGGQVTSEVLVIESSVEARKGRLARITENHPARGVLSLTSVTEQTIGAMRLVFFLQGGKPVVASVPKWYPLNQEAIDREMRAKQVSVSVRVLGGAFWMDADGADDVVDSPKGIAGTSMTGVAIRYQKGYLNGRALEVEGVGARTEQARFPNADWNGTIGEVARSASLFRLMGGGAVRLGDRYVTTLRLGVGVQVMSYDSRFTSGGTTVEGPGDSFEIDMVASVGAGFDARLGKRWILGINTAFATGLKTDAWGLDAGLNFGYRWSP